MRLRTVSLTSLSVAVVVAVVVQVVDLSADFRLADIEVYKKVRQGGRHRVGHVKGRKAEHEHMRACLSVLSVPASGTVGSTRPRSCRRRPCMA